jgi:hypothetical protein
MPGTGGEGSRIAPSGPRSWIVRTAALELLGYRDRPSVATLTGSRWRSVAPRRRRLGISGPCDTGRSDPVAMKRLRDAGIFQRRLPSLPMVVSGGVQPSDSESCFFTSCTSVWLTAAMSASFSADHSFQTSSASSISTACRLSLFERGLPCVALAPSGESVKHHEGQHREGREVERHADVRDHGGIDEPAATFDLANQGGSSGRQRSRVFEIVQRWRRGVGGDAGLGAAGRP